MNKFLDARLAAGLTQQELSDQIGIPKRTWENYEQGSRKPAPWVEKLLLEKLERMASGMIKYNVYEWEEEVKKLDDIYGGCAHLTDGSYPVLLKSFDTAEEAKQFLDTLETTIYRVGTMTGHAYQVKETWIQKDLVDEDGDLEDTIDNCVLITDTDKALAEYKEDQE